MKLCSGSSRVVVRLVPKDNLVARGEAVDGKGLRLTDGEEVDEAEDDVLDLIDNEGRRG
jgi:hypothetical protein